MSLTQRHSVWRRKKISTLTKGLMTHGNQEGKLWRANDEDNWIHKGSLCAWERVCVCVCVCVCPVLSNSLWPCQKKSQRVWLQFTLISLNQVEWQYTSPLQPPGTLALQAPLPKEFSRQECWRELSFPTSGDLPDPGFEPTSLAFPALAGRFFTAKDCF